MKQTLLSFLLSAALVVSVAPFLPQSLWAVNADLDHIVSVDAPGYDTVEIRGVIQSATPPPIRSEEAGRPNDLAVPDYRRPYDISQPEIVTREAGPLLCDSSFGDSHPGRLGFCLADINRDDDEEEDEGSSGLVVTASDVQSLGVASPQLGSSPPIEKRDWVLVNMETIAYTTSTSQTLQGEVLGVPITVTLQATNYRWDWGDGSVTHTTHPGAPWPDMSNHHFYRTRGHAAITLTTTWAGTWVAATGQTGKVLGTLETSTTSPRFEIRDWIPYLVAPNT
ncbi:MAG: hypothetical protein Q4G30_00120 [Actinomycetaceae bacterium]|nr:hypothetical protein [Actinomycetaceae bacterium]